MPKLEIKTPALFLRFRPEIFRRVTIDVARPFESGTRWDFVDIARDELRMVAENAAAIIEWLDATEWKEGDPDPMNPPRLPPDEGTPDRPNMFAKSGITLPPAPPLGPSMAAALSDMAERQ